MTSREDVRVLFARKLVETLTALLALVFLSFLFLHAMPGGPFDEEISLNPAVKENLIRQWALDQPFLTQFTHYLKGLFKGDLGSSMVQSGKTVSELLLQGFSQTLMLNVLAIIVSYLLAFFTSSVAAMKAGTLTARSIEAINVVAISLPSLFLGPVLIYLFGFYLNLLPTAFLSSPAHYILPVLTLSLRPWAQLNLLLTNSLQETLQLDFIRTAKAKGLSRWQILVNHAYKNSLMPILSMSGPLIVGLISGSFLVEILFSIPGLGQQFVESLNLRDYPVVMGLVLVYGISLIVMTNVFDACALWVDPRLRGQK
ncbi:ABC transporter permease [Bdellovibrio sp. HCB337]|uniref:ABC transporter permease n=1 Tax=Bdellovibrio sp. HCB337 TaxID=3394358 RepID=UPI0039A55B6F